MYFDPTPLNMTTLLVIALAVVAAVFLIRKRYDSNLPLLFYVVTVMFTNLSDRSLSPYLLYSGLALVLLLRFEFMGQGFAKVVGFLATSSVCLIILVFFAQVFGSDLAFF